MVRHSSFWQSICWGDGSPALVAACRSSFWQRRSWLYMDSMILVLSLSWDVPLQICTLWQSLSRWGEVVFQGVFSVPLGSVLLHGPILYIEGVVGIFLHRTPSCVCYIRLGFLLWWCSFHLGWRWLFQHKFCWPWVSMVFCRFLRWIWLVLHLGPRIWWGVGCDWSILFSSRFLAEWL